MAEPSINRIMAEINKKAGETVIGRIGNLPTVTTERISTGVEGLDKALGGGMPIGKTIELYGQPSAGKSLISLFVIKEAQKKGLECVYLDAEDTFDPEWAEKLGVDTKSLIISQSSVGEETLTLLLKLLKAKPGVIVVDSVAAMITAAELEEKIDKAFMAPKARLMSRALSMITNQNKGTLIIFINQLRSTLSLYGPKFSTPGGNALKFYASVRVEVKKTEDLHEDGKKTKPVIGQIVSFKVTKNKTAPPMQIGSFKFFYDGTIKE
jgi:recombination protein RecA